MKEKIYSIPLTDALRENSGCILCTLHKKLNEDALCYFLGPSLMEPDTREITNEKGFCKEHINALYEKNNRLGLALVLETHVKTLENSLSPKKKKTLFSENIDFSESAKAIKKLSSDCAICDRVSSQMKNAAENLVYLWDKESEFKEMFENSYGLCLEHMALAVEVCKNELGEKKATEFLEMLYFGQKEKLKKHYESLHNFTLSFDYRNSGKPLDEDTKNSVVEAVKRLSGSND